MHEDDQAALELLNEQYNLEIDPEEIDNAAYAIFLGDESGHLEDADIDDLIGFTDIPYIDEDDIFSNPFDENTSLYVLEVDEDKERILVGIYLTPSGA